MLAKLKIVFFAFLPIGSILIVDAYAENAISSTPYPEDITTSKSVDSPHCVPSITEHNAGIPIRCAGQLIFSDEFTGNKLASSKWKLEDRFPTQPNHEFVMYLRDADEVLQLRNGMVFIKPQAITQYFSNLSYPFHSEYDFGSNCTGVLRSMDCRRDARHKFPYMVIPPFVSAQFSTKDSFSFKYGRIEIRAKLPRGDKICPQLWLQPKSFKYGSYDYQSGQMRVADSRSTGAASTDLLGGVMLNAEQPWRSAKLCKAPLPRTGIDWANEFHIYSLTWTDKSISISVDNEEYCRFSPTSMADALWQLVVDDKALPNKQRLESGTLLAPFDEEFYITLGYGIGGGNEFDDDIHSWQTPWNNLAPRLMTKFWKSVKHNINEWQQNGDLLIDYVRVYSV